MLRLDDDFKNNWNAVHSSFLLSPQFVALLVFFLSLKMRYTVLFLLIVSGFRMFGQELITVDYTFAVANLPEGEKVQLAYHLGGKTYVKHAFEPSSTGILSYQSDSVHTGVYMLYFSNKGEYVQFLINEPKFSMAIDYNNLIGGLKVDGSKENQAFFDMIKYLNGQSEKLGLNDDESGLSESEARENVAVYKSLLKERQQQVVKDNPGTLLADFVRASMEIEIPDGPTGASQDEMQEFRFNYFKTHFFDNVNFENAGLLYSPVLYSRIDYYLKELTIQQPDSMIAAAKRLGELSSANKEINKFLIIHLLNEFANSKAVCMDKAYVYMVDTYYATGIADWVDEGQLEKILANANNLRNNLCGSKAYNFKLTSSDFEQVELDQVTADWTILVFLKSGCSECNELLKRLSSMELDGASYKVVTVHQKGDKDWLSQLAGYEGEGWINLIDTEGDIDWKRQYNLSSFPLVYLLDEQKNIQYKRISPAQIAQIINN